MSSDQDLFRIRDTRQTWAVYGLFIGLVAVVYFADLRHLLHRTDDAAAFRAHAAISRDFAVFFPPEKEIASGRIVDEFALWLVYSVRGNDTAAFHLLVVFAHAAASFSLALAARRLGTGMTVSLIGGLLFLVNIAHVETVQWISALEYPLAVLNASWTLYFYAGYADTHRRPWLLAFYGGMFVCVLTHIVAVLVWPLCMAWGWPRRRSLAHMAKDHAPVLPLLVPALWLVFSLTGSHTTTQVAVEASLARSAIQVFVDGTGALLWLLGRLLTMAHWLPAVSGERAASELGLGAVGLAILLWLLWRGEAEAKLWSLWTLLFTVPFTLVALVHASIARYVYMAAAGSSLLLGWALVEVCDRFGDKGRYLAGAALAAVLVSGYGAEDRIANLTQYNSGRYHIVHDDPRIGMRLIGEALDVDQTLIPMGEAYVYLLEGSLMVGDDLQDLLEQARRNAPRNHDILLVERLYAFFATSTGKSMQEEEGLDFADLQAVYAGGRPLLMHRIGILCQHFGNWYWQRGDDGRAIRAYRQSLRHAPANLNTVKRLVDILLKSDRAGAAVAAVEEIWPFHGDDSQFLYIAALSLKEAGHFDRAAQAVDRGLDLAPSAELHTLQGELLAQRGKSQDAAVSYRRAIAAGSAAPDPFTLLARWYRQEGDGAAAIVVLERAAALYPGEALVHYNLGNARYAEGDGETAVAAYERAIQLDPAYAQAQSNMGSVLLGLGRLAEAEQAYRRAVELQPDYPVFHRDLGIIARQRGDRQASLASLRRAVELGSDDPTTYTTLARLYLDGGQREQGLAVYLQMAESAWASAAGYTLAGIGLQELGQEAAAVEAYRRALGRDRDDMAACTNLGWLLFRKGNYDGAIEQFSYVTQKRTNAPAQFNLGLTYLARGDLDSARHIYARSIAEFGADEAVRIGAADDLVDLADQGIQAGAARQLLREYWSD